MTWETIRHCYPHVWVVVEDYSAPFACRTALRVVTTTRHADTALGVLMACCQHAPRRDFYIAHTDTLTFQLKTSLLLPYDGYSYYG